MSRHRILHLIFISVLIALSAVLYHRISPTILSNPAFPFITTTNTPPRTTTTTTVTMAGTPKNPAVIIVGAGLAGLSAATEALLLNAPVLLLDRAPKPGGNSIKASSGINGAPTRFQDPGKDTTFFSDTIRSAGQSMTFATAAREAQISTLTNSSNGAIEWLVDDAGVDLSLVAQLGGHSHARTHRGRGKTPPGAAIVTTLLKKLKENQNFTLLNEAEVTGLQQDVPGSGPVSGVHVTHTEELPDKNEKGEDVTVRTEKQKTFHGPVVFATGGFGGDANGLLAKWRPDLAGMPSTNDPRPGAHEILTSAGAKLVDMDKVQIHPTGFVDPAAPKTRLKFLAAEVLRGEGGILTYGGKRFLNEMDTREHVSNVIMALPRTNEDNGNGGDLRQWDIKLLLDPGACDAAASHVGFYVWKGLVVKKKVSELDAATRKTIVEYSKIVRGEGDDEFGRKVFGHWRLKGTAEDDDEEVCVGSVTPIVHFTMGGAVIDEKGRVLANELGGGEKKVIGGLWAAGEITGGLHGDNRLGGSSLLECVVFGRHAGREAAAELLRKGAVGN